MPSEIVNELRAFNSQKEAMRYETVIIRIYDNEWVAYNCATCVETSGNEDNIEDIVGKFNKEGYFVSAFSHSEICFMIFMTKILN